MFEAFTYTYKTNEHQRRRAKTLAYTILSSIFAIIFSLRAAKQQCNASSSV